MSRHPFDGHGAGRGDRSRPLRDGVLLAIGTLTALPVPAPSAVDRARARTAMLLAPLVALLPGGTAALVAAVALHVGLSPLLAAALTVGALALSSRGLHLDGLADTADGFAASYDRDRALDVMRRGDTGPAGTAAVVLVLAVQVAALAQALERLGPVAAAVAVVAGRTALPLLCARGVPAARPEGLGATMAGSVPRPAAALAVATAAVFSAGLTSAAAGSAAAGSAAAGSAAAGSAAAGVVATGEALVFGALAVGASVLVAALLGWRARRRFGGVTGDVLGACVEAGTTAALVVLAAVP